MPVAVLRDTVNGECHLVPVDNTDGIDIPRIEEGQYELSGWLKYPCQFSVTSSTHEHARAPYFTTCEDETCGKLIMLIEEQAPEFCSEHEEAI